MKRASLATAMLLAIVAGLLAWNTIQLNIAGEKTTYTTTEYATTTISIYPRTDIDDEYSIVVINGIQILAEIADTENERMKGLSGRESLEPGFGMLFIFPTEGIYSFWMYRMKFPLDIIWINSDRRVVYIIEDAQPCGDSLNCPIYTPSKPAKYVLETNAGFVESADVKIGDTVTIFLPIS